MSRRAEVLAWKQATKTSDAVERSQCGHSTRRLGKPATLGKGHGLEGTRVATLLNVNAGESQQKSAERERKGKSFRAGAVCGESRTHGSNAGDGETGRMTPRSVTTHWESRVQGEGPQLGRWVRGHPAGGAS